MLGADRFYKVVVVDSPSALPDPTIDGTGIKLTIEMKFAWTSDLQNSAGLEKGVPHDTLSANRGVLVLQEKVNPGKFSFKDSLERDMFWMQKPRAWDSVEPDNQSIEIENRLRMTEQGIISQYSVSRSDLKQATFPIYIDADITEQVSTGTDDCINQSAEFRLTTKLSCGDYNSSSYDFETGVRFTTVQIAQGATINSAYLKLHGQNKIGSNPDTRIEGQDSDNANTFSTQSDYTSRPRTSNSVSWTPSWRSNDWNTSPDIKDVVQEIVNHPNWQSNNAMVLFWKDGEVGWNSEQCRVLAWPYDDNDPTKVAEITIDYSVGTPPTSTPTPTPGGPTPTPVSGSNNAHLLIQSGGDPDGNQSFLDTSSLGTTHGITTNGNAHHETDIAYFGTSSIYFPGSQGSYLEVDDSTDLDFGTSDFTVDFWFYYTTSGNNHAVVASNFGWESSPGYTGNLWIEVDNNGGSALVPRIRVWDEYDSEHWTAQNRSSISINSWNHLALTRSGNTFYYFLNGALEESWTNSNAVRSHSNGFTLGALHDGYVVNPNFTIFQGYIEELRVIKGTAAWTSSFTPPTAPYNGDSSSPTPTPTQSGPTPTPTSPGGGGGNNNAHLLIQSGGDPDGSQVFLDTSSLGITHGITTNGNVHHETDIAYFGTSSIYFPGSQGSYLEVDDSADLDFGTSDFTVDFWFYYTTSGNNHAVVASNFGWESSPGYTGNLWIEVDNNGGSALVPRIRVWDEYDSEHWTAQNRSSISQNSWNHLALTRSGNTFYYFLNGALEESWTNSNAVRSHSNGFTLGALHDGYVVNPNFTIFQGYIEELRITKGTAAWTSSFTPPTAPYESGSSSTPTPTPTPTGGSTVPSNAQLLIQSGGHTDGSQFFWDSSPYGAHHMITTHGNVRHETDVDYFGTSSIYFTGIQGEYLEVDDSINLNFTSSDFTIDFWVRCSFSSANHCFVVSNIPGDYPYGSGGGSLWIEIDDGLVPRVRVYDSSGTGFNTSANNPSITQHSWNHIAVTKSGSSLRYFLNGSLEETLTIPNPLRSHANGITLGALDGGDRPNSNYTIFNGYIEEFRVIKGTAAWTAGFPTPAVPYEGGTSPPTSTPTATALPTGDIFTAENFPQTAFQECIANLMNVNPDPAIGSFTTAQAAAKTGDYVYLNHSYDEFDLRGIEFFTGLSSIQVFECFAIPLNQD